MRRTKHSKNAHHAAGFSLIEIAVVLAVTAAIGLAIWQLLPSLRKSADGDTNGQALLQAHAALDGFIVTNFRLPCPAAAGNNGVEDCTISSGVGELPYRTLGLAKESGQQTLRYGVYRLPNLSAPANDADLATAPVRYRPYLPTLSPSPGVFLPVSNGLDFCVGLTRAIAAPASAALRADNFPVAYALAHAGANGVFEGANASATAFTGAATASTATFDDKVAVAGLSELFGRLNCPERLGQANGAARSAYAAYDVARNAEEYLAFCRFFLEIAGYDVAFATIALALATVGVATTVVQGLIGIGLGLANFGVTFILTGLMVAANATLAGVGFSLATKAVVDTGLALTSAQEQTAAAEAFNSNAQAQARSAYLAAVALRQKGLLL